MTHTVSVHMPLGLASENIIQKEVEIFFSFCSILRNLHSSFFKISTLRISFITERSNSFVKSVHFSTAATNSIRYPLKTAENLWLIITLDNMHLG